MNEDQKRWFVEKIAQNPEYLETTYLPALEQTLRRAEFARDQANRTEGVERIKYAQGWLDGVREMCAILDGLRLAEGRKPVETGLMSRILSSALRRPANLG